MSRLKVKLIFILSFVFLISFQGISQAALPTFDAINAALNEVRNTLMQSQFAQDIALALQRLEQLKATYNELLRFHAGLDEFIDVWIGDPLKELQRLGESAVHDAFFDFGWITPKIEILEGSSEPQGIRQALEDITGSIPDSEARPYIPFEEAQVVSGFQFAKEIEDQGEATRQAAQDLITQAKAASPKGAARLGVQAMSQSMLVSQQNQEALAKLIELTATQVEQVSREEKRYERERLNYMKEFQESLKNLENLR